MSSETTTDTPFLTRVVDVFLRGDVAILLTVVSLIVGAVSLYLTPREEEPQIVVPLADVFVNAPGLSAEEVEQQVTSRLEKLLYQVDGVEYVYSMSKPGQSIVTVRFYVGEDREDSLVKLHNKIISNTDRVPPVVTDWVVKPLEVDDVPIVNISLWSARPEQYGDHELRRIAEELQNELQAIPRTNAVQVIGGRPREIRVEVDPIRLAARGMSLLEVATALRASNAQLRSGSFQQQDQEWIVEGGTFVEDAIALGDLVIGVTDDRPVYLREVANILDGPAEVDSYTWIGFGPADEQAPPATEDFLLPAVHVTVAKQKGSNAVWVADAVQRRIEQLAPTLLPEGVEFRLTRNYGETANEKVDELTESLAIAVLTVIGLIGIVLGWRPALVVAMAIPVSYSLTLFVNLLAGYTINRVTMFALILSLGLLVDDPITDVENIARYYAMRILPARQSVLRAIQEVRPALILSTLAIIVSFLPLVFITGMMGPYMAPMALNVPLTVSASTVVAFLITPWMSMVALRGMLTKGSNEETYEVTRLPLYRFYQRIFSPLLDRKSLSVGMLAVVGLLFVGAVMLPAFRLVPLKMLPYDNKNEFQIVVDMPEGTSLDRTDAVTRAIAEYMASVVEVRDLQAYVGLASAMDFNGMVRHYFLRQGPNVADIRVNLADKDVRAQQSHEILLRLRNDLSALAEKHGANIKLVEVPPGPPVMATITAEVYGPAEEPYGKLVESAEVLAERLRQEPGVVDVDTSGEAEQTRWVFETDKPKAALSGISTEDIAETLQIALSGREITVLHDPWEVYPLWITLRVPRELRSSIDDLSAMYLVGKDGQTVRLGALGKFVEQKEYQTIYHKNLRPVSYVYAEVGGRPPADAIIDIQLDRTDEGELASANVNNARPAEERTWFSPGGGIPWALPPGTEVEWAGEGEWKITLDVFRDLGLAFGAALVGIFVLLMFQTKSRVLPIVIMLSIPLTMIGIMPGFWLLNLFDRPVGGYPNPVFFTATAMIGMIALSGIVIRNSVVLIDFIHHSLEEGHTLREAIIRSVSLRTRPILLTAATTLLGNWVITLDPIFSGLAWAIIFGLFSSTVFTIIVVPLVYWLLYGGKKPSTAVPSA